MKEMNDTEALFVDLYELTMGQCYFEEKQDVIATFDLFIRRLPPNRSYFVACGLEDAISFLEGFKFGDQSIDYLKSQKIFSDNFLEYLKNLQFTGEVQGLPEGSVFFPNEPILRVTAPIIEAQLVESALLNTFNLQTTIATKASRVVTAAQGHGVYDFSLRRTQGRDAAIKAARASYIAGCKGTSNVLAGALYGIPVAGTMAHSFVMSFESELESFRVFAKSFPQNSILLIDTYDNLRGVENAIRVAKEMEEQGNSVKGVRLDSGDIVSLSKVIRKKLDEAGFKSVRIFASGNLDEYKIEKLLKRGAMVDDFGVGTKMGTSEDIPHSDVIYKIVQLGNKAGRFLPTMKLSQGKVTYPGKKQIFRFRDNKGLFTKDVVGLEGEKIGGEPLLVKLMENGKRVYTSPGINQIRDFTLKNLSALPSKYKILKGNIIYPVEISPGLKILMEDLTRKIRQRSQQ